MREGYHCSCTELIDIIDVCESYLGISARSIKNYDTVKIAKIFNTM